MIPEAMFSIEEVSSCAAQASRRMFKGLDFGAEALLRLRLDEEADRYVVAEWIAYKQQLRQMEALLRKAGVPHHTITRSCDELDVSAIDLYCTGRSRLLEVGLEVGYRLVTRRPFVFTLPAMRTMGCKSLGKAEPALMLVYLPDDRGERV